MQAVVSLLESVDASAASVAKLQAESAAVRSSASGSSSSSSSSYSSGSDFEGSSEEEEEGISSHGSTARNYGADSSAPVLLGDLKNTFGGKLGNESGGGGAGADVPADRTRRNASSNNRRSHKKKAKKSVWRVKSESTSLAHKDSVSNFSTRSPIDVKHDTAVVAEDATPSSTTTFVPWRYLRAQNKHVDWDALFATGEAASPEFEELKRLASQVTTLADKLNAQHAQKQALEESTQASAQTHAREKEMLENERANRAASFAQALASGATAAAIERERVEALERAIDEARQATVKAGETATTKREKAEEHGRALAELEANPQALGELEGRVEQLSAARDAAAAAAEVARSRMHGTEADAAEARRLRAELDEAKAGLASAQAARGTAMTRLDAVEDAEAREGRLAKRHANLREELGKRESTVGQLEAECARLRGEAALMPSSNAMADDDGARRRRRRPGNDKGPRRFASSASTSRGASQDDVAMRVFHFVETASLRATRALAKRSPLRLAFVAALVALHFVAWCAIYLL